MLLQKESTTSLDGKRLPNPKPVGQVHQTYYYNDLKCFVHNVDRLIQANRGIDSEYVREAVPGMPRVPDLATCQSHWKNLDDEKLKDLVNRFFQNMLDYGSCYYVVVSPTSSKLAEKWWEGTDDQKRNCQEASQQLTRMIVERIQNLLVHKATRR